jgi:hypothetical protein
VGIFLPRGRKRFTTPKGRFKISNLCQPVSTTKIFTDLLLKYWLFIQEVWKVSTTAGARRVKKGPSAQEASSSSNQSTKESEASSKSGISALLFPATNQPSVQVGSAQVST